MQENNLPTKYIPVAQSSNGFHTTGCQAEVIIWKKSRLFSNNWPDKQMHQCFINSHCTLLNAYFIQHVAESLIPIQRTKFQEVFGRATNLLGSCVWGSNAGSSQLGVGAEDSSWTRHAGHMLCIFSALFISLLALGASSSFDSTFIWSVNKLVDM